MNVRADFLLARYAEDRTRPNANVADIEAKESVVAYHAAGMAYLEHGADDAASHAYYRAGLITLRFLAAVYADHPDYPRA